jgi:hypothetical protein
MGKLDPLSDHNHTTFCSEALDKTLTIRMAIDTAEGKRRYLYPSETSRHAATILGFPSKFSIAAAYYESACFEIASLASAISAFEPVRLFTRPEDIAKAQALVEQTETKYPSNKSNIQDGSKSVSPITHRDSLSNPISKHPIPTTVILPLSP